MAKPIISDRVQAIDQLTNRKISQSAKRQFLNRYLADLAKQDHRPHYSDHFFFNAPVSANAEGGV